MFADPVNDVSGAQAGVAAARVKQKETSPRNRAEKEMSSRGLM